MPISPYSTARPVAFEYKPLGLEAFGQPLAQMQNRFDKSISDAYDLKTKISNISVDPENKRASAIQKDIEGSKQKLLDELLTKKNFRSGERQIMKLNKIYNEDPEKLAIEGNLATFQKADKEEEERWKKGDIKREQYLDWRARQLQDFSSKGGTSYKNEREYNQIGTTGRLKDQEENIRKEIDALMKSAPEKVRETLGNFHNMEEADYMMQALNTTIKEKSGPELEREVRAILLGSDTYKDYANEVADYDVWKLKQNPKEYTKTAQSLTSKESQDIFKQIADVDAKARQGNKKAKEVQNSQEYRDLKQQATDLKSMASGEKQVNSELVDPLYMELRKNQIFDTKPYADHYAYRNITKGRERFQIPKEARAGYDLEGNPISVFVDPTQDGKVNLSTISSNINTAKKQSVSIAQGDLKNAGLTHALIPVGKEYQYSKGIARKKPNGEFEWLNKSTGQWWTPPKERQEAIREEIYSKQFSNPETTYTSANNLMVAFERSNGDFNKFRQESSLIGQPMTEFAAKEAFQNLSKTGNYETLKNNTLPELERSATNYKVNLNINKELTNNYNQDPNSNEINKLLINELKLPSIGEINPNSIYNPNKYSKEQLKKIGVVVEGGQIISNPQFSKSEKEKAYSTQYLSGEQVAKLNGYSSVEDAYKKGLFNKVTINNINIPQQLTKNLGVEDPVNSFVGSSIGGINARLKQGYINKNSDKLSNVHAINGSKELNKDITNLAPTLTELQAFKPMFVSNWADYPEFFDEEGNPLKGTERVKAADRLGTVPGVNKGVLLYGLKNKEGKTMTVPVDPKSNTVKNLSTTTGAWYEHIAKTGTGDSKAESLLVLNNERNPIRVSESEINTTNRNISFPVHSITFEGKRLEIRREPLNGKIASPTYNIYFEGQTQPLNTLPFKDLNKAIIFEEESLRN